MIIKFAKNHENDIKLPDIPAEVLASPQAQRAMLAGLLKAKREALASAERLARWGRPLLIAIILVSFVHLWETIAKIAPPDVGRLRLPDWVHHATAAALTLAIDAAALFASAAGGAARLAGHRPTERGKWFFLLLTFTLNMAFVARYAPALPESVRSLALPTLDLLFLVALPAFIPVAIVAIEHANDLVQVLRLKLITETTALEQLIAPVKKSVNASQSDNGREPVTIDALPANEPIAGGRRTQYQLTDLLSEMEDGANSTAQLMERLSCGKTTLAGLIAEGIEAGKIERVRRGQYRRLQ